MIYTVTFNPAIDYVVRMEKLEIGSVNRSREEALFYGGKGINVSTVLKNLGVDSVALGFVAGFTGKAIEEGVAALGVKADFITVSDGVSRINVKLKAGEETEINGKGPNISDAELEELYKKLDGLTDGDCLVLACKKKGCRGGSCCCRGCYHLMCTRRSWQDLQARRLIS